MFFFFSSRRRHTRCALVTGVQTCALPISGLAPADGGHRVAGVGEAVELEAPARARNRIVDTLAQDNAATLELDLQDGALAQAQRVAHRLGQSDLATFEIGRAHV